ncbi:tetratricopeptide repeat protein [Pseudodesulfovibrio sp.]|uniref:tetratricopeptide repeat protein n=1 Tax=unclassified Pseudodesulfovibrio TaxID=2661612 RepID=UPI003B007773
MTANDLTGHIEGVFSTEKKGKIGTGTTARRVTQTSYYFCVEGEDGNINIQLLNNKNVPTGEVTQISKDTLLEEYLPMPQLYKEVMGNVREIQKSVARGEKFRKRGETFTAEFEFNKALNLDEQNVRANFGVGLCLLARDEAERAQEVFERILQIDSAFGEEHKHLFNEYGIELRKKKMLDQAIEYYGRALDLTDQDENLWYNLARARFDKEDYAGAADAVTRCLELEPRHEHAQKMLNYINKKELI